jgi:hypothetical protein
MRDGAWLLIEATGRDSDNGTTQDSGARAPGFRAVRSLRFARLLTRRRGCIIRKTKPTFPDTVVSQRKLGHTSPRHVYQ